jgi:PIN domain nuclease of toxin-antitoxin system
MGSVPRLRLLLDTHIWIWSLQNPDKLSRQVMAAIEHEANDLLLSPMSLFEAAGLLRKQRLSFENGLAGLREALAASRIKEAALTFEIAARAGALDVEHRDPADLIIAATALESAATLVTADRRLRTVPGLDVLFNAGSA